MIVNSWGISSFKRRMKYFSFLFCKFLVIKISFFYYLNKNENNIRGVFSGLGIENHLISGEVEATFESVEMNYILSDFPQTRVD